MMSDYFIQRMVQQVTEMPPEAGSAITVSWDIAAMIAAIAWPVILLILLLAYRNKMPEIFKSMASLFSRVEKLSVGNFSIELAKVAAYSPKWTTTDISEDLRRSMRSADLVDHVANHFTLQLTDTTPAEYAVIDLGEGKEWLTSRLYIMSILMERIKGIKAFVFVKSMGEVQKRFVGWARPSQIRWSFAKRYSWLEENFAHAYSSIFDIPSGIGIVSSTGSLGDSSTPINSEAGIGLVRKFLEINQSNVQPGLPDKEEDWVHINAKFDTYEHAQWLTADEVEGILEGDLFSESVGIEYIQGKSGLDRIKPMVAIKSDYIPITDEKHRFKELIDRQMVLEMIASNLA